MGKCRYCEHYDEDSNDCTMVNRAFFRGGRGCEDYEEAQDELENESEDQDEPWY